MKYRATHCTLDSLAIKGIFSPRWFFFIHAPLFFITVTNFDDRQNSLRHSLSISALMAAGFFFHSILMSILLPTALKSVHFIICTLQQADRFSLPLPHPRGLPGYPRYKYLQQARVPFLPCTHALTRATYLLTRQSLMELAQAR